jgi:hypothetical protein
MTVTQILGAHHNQQKCEFKAFSYLETEKILQVKVNIPYHTQ